MNSSLQDHRQSSILSLTEQDRPGVCSPVCQTDDTAPGFTGPSPRPGGGKHNKCAMDCAKMGIPAGVVDSRTGQVFTVLAPTPGLAQYMGKTVRITGSLAAKSTAIIPDKLEVSEDGKWKAGELPESMM